MKQIGASVLSADFSQLGHEIARLEKCQNISSIHFDIMDGHFVPNLTFGAGVIKSLRNYCSKTFDVHLMVTNPQDYFKPLADAGADIITFHQEATVHHDKLVNSIKDLGIKAGIAINPSTPPQTLEYLLNDLDLILVMTVNPGFGGQKFISSQYTKIKAIKKMIENNNSDIIIAVDGGVNSHTAPDLFKCGANLLVAGSFIFSGKDSDYNQKAAYLLKDN